MGIIRQDFIFRTPTLIMARQEHVHIISAGENIYPSYAATVRDYPDITQMFVFVDTELYTNSLRDEGAVREQKEAAREEVTKVKSLSATLSIPASLVYVVPPADVSARDAVMKIRKGHPDAKFSFDLTAGSKDLSMALFAISLWVGGNAFYAFGGRKNGAENAKLAVPKIPAVNVAANPNYIRILQTLARKPGKQEASGRVLPRHYIFTQLESFYVPVRKKGVNVIPNVPGKTDVNTGKKAIIPRLSQGTLSSLLNTLASLDMIRDVPGADCGRREKYYRITPNGELALQLTEIKPRNG
ncbi:MAG: hypothetical protein ABSB80_01400 [Methanoregula sp.]|uniref:hypothetical protein n=1 Tax=Methanoregula sp. TaxID=2052170 RepID=UPI003D1317DB